MAGCKVTVQSVLPRTLAATRRDVTIGNVGTVWKPALDKVWEFLRSQPGLHAGGHNVFLYHHATNRESTMQVDFGVEVTRPFARSGEIDCTETPGGEVALAVHLGPYARLRQTHDAIHAWCKDNGRTIAGKSWEIYGDWTSDETRLETTVVYLLHGSGR
ncbi:MAG TPA: GyrI-like domain-containing protein [Polyangiaceae bacterium]|nr:GyrI-like domain-containing protein [Polyangiaceae bacterium]